MKKLKKRISKVEKELVEGIEPSLSSFDYGDVLSSPIYLRLNKHLPPVTRKALRIPEFLFPLYWRKLLKVEKKLIPANLYHIGMYHLIRFKNTQDKHDRVQLIEILKRAVNLAKSYDEYVFWEHTYEHHGIAWKQNELKNQHGNSCAHHTSRLGLLFYYAGDTFKNQHWTDIAIKSANTLVDLHYWSFYEDGTAAMSYYPHTADEVINTSAEASVLLGFLSDKRKSFSKTFKGLHRMVLSELSDKGRWAYCTQRHYTRYPNEVQFIDCHHTCMNITSLVLNYANLPEELKQETSEVIRRSARAFCRDFIREKSLTYFPDNPREATFAGYGEAMILFSTLINHLDDTEQLENLEEFKKNFHKVMDLSIKRFYVKSARSVASSRFLGMKVDIRSVRFGAGLMLESLARYHAFLR